MIVLSRVRKLWIALGALGISLACMQPALLTPTPTHSPIAVKATPRPTETTTPTPFPNTVIPSPRVTEHVLGKWNLRSGPGMGYPMILVLEDVDVRILESKVTYQPCQVWLRVEIDRTFGWICSEAVIP